MAKYKRGEKRTFSTCNSAVVGVVLGNLEIQQQTNNNKTANDLQIFKKRGKTFVFIFVFNE